jgi:hypothetical protein
LGRRHELTPHHVKILAIIGQVFFGNGVGAAVAALLGDAGVVADAIKADLEVRATAVAGL